MVQYNAMQGLQAFGAGRQMGTEMRVGNALAEGNMQGAQQAAFRGGDNQLGMQLQTARQEAAQQLRDRATQASDQEAAQLAGVYQTAGQIANGLMTVPVEQRQQALMQIAPRLQQMGLPQEQLQQLAQAIGDPNASDAVLQTYASLAVDADEIFKARAPVTLNQGDVRGGYQGGRFAQVGENVDEVGQANARTNARNADTSAMNARTSRMAEDRAARQFEQQLEDGDPPSQSDIRALRNEFEGNYARPFEEAQDGFMTMEQLAGDQTGASDTALIFSFFKAIDPASTVRQGEFALAAQSMGLSDRIIAQLQRYDDGQILVGNARNALVNAAGRSIHQRAQTVQQAQQRYDRLSNLAFGEGYSEQVVRDPSRLRPELISQPQSQSAPTRRTVQDPETGENVIVLDD